MALRMLPDTTAYGPYRQVSVRLELRSDYEGITTLAIAIEGSGKLVRIRKLEIASEGRNSTAEESLQLRGTLTVDALTLSSAESEQ